MTVTYRTGYGTRRRSLSELRVWSEFAAVHPEMQRRLIAWMDGCRARGVDVGIGEGIRTTAEQEAVFFDRHTAVASGGCCGYAGKRYALKAGLAHVAPPGRSYHEPTVGAFCLAVDTVGHNSVSESLLAAYGLRSFNNLSGSAREPWHVQPVEVPTARANYNPAVHVIKVFALPSPTAPQPAEPDYPTPVLRLGSTNITEVRELQQHCTLFGWYTAQIDGVFGPVTEQAVRRMQGVLRTTQDGVYGNVTANLYLQFLKGLQGLA
jgi:hypothetical protein